MLFAGANFFLQLALQQIQQPKPQKKTSNSMPPTTAEPGKRIKHPLTRRSKSANRQKTPAACLLRACGVLHARPKPFKPPGQKTARLNQGGIHKNDKAVFTKLPP